MSEEEDNSNTNSDVVVASDNDTTANNDAEIVQESSNHNNNKEYRNDMMEMERPLLTDDGNEEEETPPLIIEELPPVVDDDEPKNTTLAFCPTTPRWATFLLPLAAIATHVLFAYGQLQPMWYLHQSQHVDMWYNASSTASTVFYKAVGLPHDVHITHDDQSTIQTFTYSFAIHELWEAKGMPGSKLMPRVASVLLVIFSGIWPHLKLLLLQVTWWTMRNPHRRTRMLHWLSCLGKWSLADILVVCVMVGVLHIDWIVDPDAIRVGVSQHLPFLLQLITSQFPPQELCTKLLKYNCHKPSTMHYVPCEACTTAFSKTDWTGSAGQSILKGIHTSGGGMMQLRVIGMKGIYAFCAAVVISILLSLIVDVWDHKARNYDLMQTVIDDENDLGEEGGATTRYRLLEGGDEEEDDDNNNENAALLDSHLNVEMGNDSSSRVDNDNERTIPKIRWFSCFHGVLSLVVAVAVLYSCFTVTFERRVVGAIPKLLHQVLAMEWTKNYSLYSLGATTGAAGGWDYLLQATFGLFIVFGPILRGFLCVLGHIVPGRLSTIQTFCDLIGAFCAWEVLVIAVVMIGLLMPSITGTILSDSRCSELDASGQCFQVYYETLQPTFYFIIGTGFALVVVSNSFTYFAKHPPRK